ATAAAAALFTRSTERAPVAEVQPSRQAVADWRFTPAPPPSAPPPPFRRPVVAARASPGAPLDACEAREVLRWRQHALSSKASLEVAACRPRVAALLERARGLSTRELARLACARPTHASRG